MSSVAIVTLFPGLLGTYGDSGNALALTHRLEARGFSAVCPTVAAGDPIPLEGDVYLLCSDGLWGTLSDEEITKQLARQPVSHAVPELVEEALRKAGDSSDNVTVVALEGETPDAFESTQGVSTDSISDDVFASTIQAGPLDGLADDLDDAAIERSIAEINEAIRRSAARRG